MSVETLKEEGIKKDEVTVVEVFKDIAEFSKKEIRDIIDGIQSEVEGQDQLDIPVTHYFSKDVYAREVKIPAGTIVVGKIHKFENLNILSKGDISLLSIDGVQRVQAPFTVVSSPSVKRVAYTHTDCVWTTIHGTDERDVDKIEEKFIAKSYEEIEEKLIDLVKEEKLCLG